MKSASKLFALLCFVAFLGFSSKASARERETFTKTIQKEYAIPADGTTYLDTRYGTTQVKTWDKNKVKITVHIEVKANSKSTADGVFDRIQIQFSNGNDYVKATTNIESGSSWQSWQSWLGGSKTDYTINYEVYLPETNRLDLAHRYGDAYIGSLTGKAFLNIKYGNLKAERVGDQSALTIGYSKATISHARNLSAEISYSEVSLEEAQQVRCTTKYTKLHIEKAKDVEAISKYDTYTIGTIHSLRNSGSYDNFRIESAASVQITTGYTQIQADNISESLELTAKYSGLDAKFSAGFNAITIDGSYSNTRLGIPSEAGYSLDAHTEYTSISYPDNLNIHYDVKNNNAHTVRGKRGNADNARIKLNLRYGSGTKLYTY